MRTVGAPPGLTMHWLQYELPVEFKKNYRVTYNQRYHHYRYARYKKRTLIDEFIVVRTSKKCYRVVYFNNDYLYFKYFSSRNYRDCARIMNNVFKTFKEIE